MTCTGAQIPPELARKGFGAISCPPTQQLRVAAAESLHRNGRRRRRPNRANPSVRHRPSGALDESGCTTGCGSHHATAARSLPSVFPTHRSAGAAAGGGAAAAVAGEPRTTDTAGAMAKHGSRSTGAIPVLPALSSTVPADNGASSSSVGNPASEEGPKRRGSSFDRKACGGGGGERRRRKQRRHSLAARRGLCRPQRDGQAGAMAELEARGGGARSRAAAAREVAGKVQGWSKGVS